MARPHRFGKSLFLSALRYFVELKYDHSAEEALRQINEKMYARPFHTDSRKIFKIGVNFSSETRCIEGWRIEEG
ncbi:MAG: ATP-binding protein [Muribaculaceae bacterium]|nr:ATP-binding protein [Muribaculaceae bacterium]